MMISPRRALLAFPALLCVLSYRPRQQWHHRTELKATARLSFM